MSGDDEHDLSTMVRADQIRWTPLAIDQIEDINILELDENELLAYLENLRDETAWLRLLLSESLTLINRQRDQLARAAKLTDFQRQQLHQMRKRIAA